MNLLRLLAVALMLIVPLVSCCEGECIVGITKAICGNYTVVVARTLMNVVSAQISLFAAAENLPGTLSVALYQ